MTQREGYRRHLDRQHDNWTVRLSATPLSPMKPDMLTTTQIRGSMETRSHFGAGGAQRDAAVVRAVSFDEGFLPAPAEATDRHTLEHIQPRGGDVHRRRKDSNTLREAPSTVAAPCLEERSAKDSGYELSEHPLQVGSNSVTSRHELAVKEVQFGDCRVPQVVKPRLVVSIAEMQQSDRRHRQSRQRASLCRQELP